MSLICALRTDKKVFVGADRVLVFREHLSSTLGANSKIVSNKTGDVIVGAVGDIALACRMFNLVREAGSELVGYTKKPWLLTQFIRHDSVDWPSEEFKRDGQFIFVTNDDLVMVDSDGIAVAVIDDFFAIGIGFEGAMVSFETLKMVWGPPTSWAEDRANQALRIINDAVATKSGVVAKSRLGYDIMTINRADSVTNLDTKELLDLAKKLTVKETTHGKKVRK